MPRDPFGPSIDEMLAIARESPPAEREAIRRRGQFFYGQQWDTAWKQVLTLPPEIARANRDLDAQSNRMPDGFLTWARAGEASAGKRVIPLNSINPLRKEQLLDSKTRKLLRARGVSGGDAELYAAALRYKATATDDTDDAAFPDVLRALGHLKQGGVLVNVGPAHEPLVPVLAAAAWRFNQAGWFEAWTEADAEARGGPGSESVPFGAHKGKSISELPESYLDWLQRVIPEIQEFNDARRRQASVNPRALGGAAGFDWMYDESVIKVPDLENPWVPESGKRPRRGTYFDPVDLVRRYRRSGKEMPSFKVRVEDYAGMDWSKVPYHVRRSVDRIFSAMTQESFVGAFESYVSRPDVRERIALRTQALSEQMERDRPEGSDPHSAAVKRKRNDEEPRRFEEPYTRAERKEALLLHGRRLPELTSPSQLRDLARSRNITDAHRFQSPGSVQGYFLKHGASSGHLKTTVSGGGFPAPEDIAEGLSAPLAEGRVKAWQHVVETMTLIEEAKTAHDVIRLADAMAVRWALDQLPDAVRREFRSAARKRAAVLRSKGRTGREKGVAHPGELERRAYDEATHRERGGRVVRKEVEDE